MHKHVKKAIVYAILGCITYYVPKMLRNFEIFTREDYTVLTLSGQVLKIATITLFVVLLMYSIYSILCKQKIMHWFLVFLYLLFISLLIFTYPENAVFELDYVISNFPSILSILIGVIGGFIIVCFTKNNCLEIKKKKKQVFISPMINN